MATESQTLLICSVGGAPEPVVHSLLHWRPARALFLPSEKTRHTTDVALRDYAERVGEPIPAGAWEQYVLADEEDFARCVGEMRRALEPEVARWRSRGGDFRVIVDFTGGTKCMSAALALVARRWRCLFSYVGGERRNKGGIGIVESGAERVLHSANPWDSLGYQVVEEAVAVFNCGGFAAASGILDHAIHRTSYDSRVKRELSTLKAVVDAYAAWDRFDHKLAKTRLEEALKNRNDLHAIFAQGTALIRRLESDCQYLGRLSSLGEPAIEWVLDLLANAQRRAAERRFDDAVARLYRAVEALAQVILRRDYGIDCRAVTLEKLPPTLQQEWASRGRDGRSFMLGLQDAYRVLRELENKVGYAFYEAGLATEGGKCTSPLVARNNSILAHGFEPVSEAVYAQLRAHLTELLEFAGADLTAAQSEWRLPEPGASG